MWESELMRNWEPHKAFLDSMRSKYHSAVLDVDSEELNRDYEQIKAIRRYHQDEENKIFSMYIDPIFQGMQKLKRRTSRKSSQKRSQKRSPAKASSSRTAPLQSVSPPAISSSSSSKAVSSNSKSPKTLRMPKSVRAKPKLNDIVAGEIKSMKAMQLEFDNYLGGLLADRLHETLDFGKDFSPGKLADYLYGLFGDNLYFDSFLSLIQQYSLTNAPITNSKGTQFGKTGFNLAFFGSPGTGKTFAIKEMILGNPDRNIAAHGLPGRNRYCGGMTAAFFIRMAEAYVGQSFNFVIPEFKDWFVSSKGMSDRLKLAMENGQVSYENFNEKIGPYAFDSFFAVNYNTKVGDGGYANLVNDPNFAAIEDRMLCNVEIMSKERYSAIAKSQKDLQLGNVEMDQAEQIRDHLTLVYAIQTEHPAVRAMFPKKSVEISPNIYDALEAERNDLTTDVLEEVPFSLRLEDRAIRLAAAMTQVNYFRGESLHTNEEVVAYAAQFFRHEAEVRLSKK